MNDLRIFAKPKQIHKNQKPITMLEESQTHIGVIVPVLIVVFVAIIVVILMWLKT